MNNIEITPIGQVIKGIEKLPNLEHAHYIDIVVRINGNNVTYQGDWIKYLQKLYFPNLLERNK